MKRILLSIALFASAFASHAQQIPSYIPTADLLMWVPFDSNFVDLSSNPNNITNNGVTLMSDRNGIANRAGNFNGTGAFMQAATPTFTFAQTDTFSYSVWVKKETHSTSAGADIALMTATNTTGVFITIIQFSNTSSSMNFGANKQQASWAWATTTYNLSQWDNYIALYEGGAMTLYLNGNQVATATFTNTGSTASNIPFNIGKGLAAVTFKGGIDDIAVWGRALNTQEISDVYNNVFTGVEKKANEGTLRLYPNPAENVVYVNVKSTYEIRNMLGALVVSGRSNAGSIDVQDLTQGIYFISFGNDPEKTFKFIKR